MPTALTNDDVRGYDFLDLGCSRGNSLRYGDARFGPGKGLGVDRSEDRIAEARNAGFDAVVADAMELDVTDQVSWVQMMDLLEHLPDTRSVEKAITRAARAATDFLFIFHPSFEREEYLASLGLRLYWWNWRTHKTHVRIDDFCRMFHRLGLEDYRIRYRIPIFGADHPFVLSSDEPSDQQEWDAAHHQAKPNVMFEQPVWRAQEIFVALRPMAGEEWARITAPLSGPRQPGAS